VNRDEIGDVLALMKVSWNVQFDDLDVRAWGSELLPYDFDDACVVLRQLVDEGEPFAPKLPVFVQRIKQARGHREMVLARAEMADRICDGTGWISHGDDSVVPCPTCNPYLAQLNPSEWRQYFDGARLDGLHPHVQWVKHRLVGDGPMPEPCKPSYREDPTDPVLRRWDLALAVIKRGYWESQETYGLSEAEIEAGWRQHYRPKPTFDGQFSDVFTSVNEAVKVTDPYQATTARGEETTAVYEAIQNGADHYTKIQSVVGHRVAQRCLRRLEQDGRLVWRSNGDLILRPEAIQVRYTPRTTPSAPRPAPPAPSPPERPTDPAPGISVADAAAQVAQNIAEDGWQPD
jgi:hypothetical protein